ncbi:MAG: hypothetical protein SNJ56_04420, partial [Termitinemataceae bacterium]
NPGAGVMRDPGRRGLVFVQVDTDEGITGWGEITTYPGPVANRAVAAFVDQVGAWLRGEDPSAALASGKVGVQQGQIRFS